MNHRSLALLALIAGLAVPSLLIASEAERFAWAWPLEAQEEHDLWRVRLTAELIESLHLADASDLAIVDSQGRPVVFSRIGDEHLIEPLHQSQVLEQHSSRTLTTVPEAAGLELSLSQGDTRLVIHSPRTGAPPQTRGQLLFEALLAAPSVAPAPARHELVLALDSQHQLNLDCWLKDADEPGPALQRARFNQIGDSRPRRFEARVEHDSLPTAWYLACYGSQAPDDLTLSQARLDSIGSHDHRQAESIEPELVAAEGTSGTFEFETAGPFRARSITLGSRQGNQLSELIIESRSEYTNQRPDQGWQHRARVVLSTLGDAREISTELSHPQRRDRFWRIRSEPPLTESPLTRLDIMVEELAFLSQGDPPWQLLTGSLESGPILSGQRIIDSGRVEYGPPWEWPLIASGPRQLAGGPEVLIAPPRPVPWSRYLLWTILVLAAGLVIWLAAGLLRRAD